MKEKSLAQKKKERNMKIVLHDALHYFEKNGYDNTTVEQLCEEAMISPSTFFNYFGSKEKIIELIMQEGIDEYREFCETERTESGNLIESIEKCIDFEIKATMKYPNIITVFHRLTLQSEVFRKMEEEYNWISADLIHAAFEANGKSCPLSRQVLADLIGGYFAIPVMTSPSDQWETRIRNCTREFLTLLWNSAK